MMLTDQLNRTLSVKMPIKSIVSLVPSHTELLFDLNLRAKIKGRTKFCIHPNEFVKHVPIIGGTKNLHHEQIKSINPDLIIANKEENRKEDVLELAKHFPVWVSDIKTIQDSMDMIDQMGTIFNETDTADSLKKNTLINIKNLSNTPLKRAAYLIWKDPYMTVGSDTYIHNMMGHLGFENVFAKQKRYPVVTIEEIRKAKPQVILLSSEPFPFAEKHKKQLKQEYAKIEIEVVDGEVFSWFGSRIIHKNSILFT